MTRHRSPLPTSRAAESAATMALESTLELRSSELAQATEQQAATAEILRVISRSPTDAQPVFETIATAALKLCGARSANVLSYDGTRLHVAAMAIVDPRGVEAMGSLFPRPASHDSAAGRAVLTRSVVVIADVLADPDYMSQQAAVAAGFRSILGVPLLRGGEPIGAIAVGRAEPGPFPASQIALLQVFAEQAVIAIVNVRLFNEREARNRELAEALEHQTATNAILRVLSQVPNDVQPVFEAIVNAGVRLFEGAAVAISRHEAGQVRSVAIAEEDPQRAARWRNVFPFPLSREYIHGAAIIDCRVVDVPDVLVTGGQFEAGKRNLAPSGYRAMTVVPLIREGAAIGAIAVVRMQPGGLSAKQIGLLQTFADQAVIAIENVRLFNELQDKTRQLEVASRHKSAFLANMSHELRTPMNAILGFTRIVLRQTRDRIDAKQAGNLEKILASARHLIGLINATLDLSRIEAGRIEITASDLALAPLLDECLRSVEPLLADGVSLDHCIAPDLPPMHVDGEKLRQIVINLLSNAVKFTERGRIDVSARADSGQVEIAVADTGIGIPADKLEAVFEEFEQVDASHTRTHGGTGLGLAIARRLARAMGGELRAQTVLGAGSTFTLNLPLRYVQGASA